MLDDHTALRILILNGDLPIFPGRAGHEYLHTTRLARLGQHVGLVSMVHTPEQREKQQGLTEAGVTLYLWESPDVDTPSADNGSPVSWLYRMSKAIYTFARTWPRRPQDTVLQDLQFANLSGPALQALNDTNWHALIVVQTNCARWVDYLPHFPVSVLVMHDVRALVYERRRQVASSLGEWLTSLLQGWLYRRFEGAYCRTYDLVVTVSSADEAWVRQHYRPRRLATIPIPVDSHYFVPLPDVREATARVLFTGMMDHPPNVDAACFFAQQVLPRVRMTIHEAEFWIVGRNPAPKVTALADLPGVVVTGFVLDIRPCIAQATVVVVPLRFGSGMRNKILEAWAMQKCVVSTQIGAEGLDYQDGVNILIADDAQTMADRVIRIIQEPAWRDQLRTQGRELITVQHHPKKLAHKYYRTVAAIWREKQQQSVPMHTVIDLRWMHPGVAGGIENLARSFLNQLLCLDGCNRYTILVPAEASYDFDLRSRPNFRLVRADGPGHYGRQLLWHGARLLHRGLNIAYWRSPAVETLRQAHSAQADVVLSLSGYIYTDMYPCRNVLVVHDLQHEYHPEFFPPHTLEERTRVFGEAIRRADHLIAVSEYTRQTVLERYAVEPTQIHTVYEAADPIFCPENWRRLDIPKTLGKYGLAEGEYVFFPANTWAHKNHQGLLEALARLRDEYHLRPVLVCTGASKEAHTTIKDTIQRLGLTRQVRFLGYCPLPDMPALYAGAAALVFPSFFEGFGLPLVEAMWCDCPIVCSNVTSLPEIAGAAALLVDPRVPEQLAEAISRLLTDTDLRQMLIARGRQQVRQFSWHNFTVETIRILHHVHTRHDG